MIIYCLPHVSVRRAGALLALAASFTGCVSSKYKLAPNGTPPPAALNLTSSPAGAIASQPGSAAPAVEAVVHSVIVYKGPGSWKNEAFWDEYSVTFVNRGTEPVIIESATLTDFQGRIARLGDNPWTLEKESRTQADRLARTAGDVFKIGGGALVTTSALFTVGAVAVGGSLSGYVGTSLAATAGIVAVPVVVVGSVYRSIDGKHRVEAEFARRRLTLPAPLAPGQAVQGSLFFGISPGPQRLTLHCRADRERRDVSVDLAPLAGLHLRSTTVLAAPAQ